MSRANTHPLGERAGALTTVQDNYVTSPIPSLRHQDYDVGVLLRIRPSSDPYQLEIWASGQPQLVQYPIGITRDDLAGISKSLQSAMSWAAFDNTGEQEPNSKEATENLATLVEEGHYAFNKIFSDSDARAAIQRLYSRNKRITIQIAAETFFVPWELLYPVGLSEKYSYEHFWGSKHIIQRVIVPDRQTAIPQPRTYRNEKPKFGLLIYDGLPNVVSKELPYFENLAKEGKISLVKLESLGQDDRRGELGKFRRFWSDDFDVAHFACHAYYVDPSKDSYMLLNNEFAITIQDLANYGIGNANSPLVVMNACETGNLNPLYTSYFARVFIELGVLGVVATECPVPDAFAADFAQQLYSHLLGGRPLGESLLASRQFFLREYSNPTGLFYSMYAAPNIRIPQEERRG